MKPTFYYFNTLEISMTLEILNMSHRFGGGYVVDQDIL